MARRNKPKSNQHFKSHITHSSTNKAIDSLAEIKGHHSYSRLQCPAKWRTVYGSAWKTKHFRQGGLRKLEHTNNAQATVLTRIS